MMQETFTNNDLEWLHAKGIDENFYDGKHAGKTLEKKGFTIKIWKEQDGRYAVNLCTCVTFPGREDSPIGGTVYDKTLQEAFEEAFDSFESYVWDCKSFCQYLVTLPKLARKSFCNNKKKK